MACSILDKIPVREWKGLVPSFVNGRFHLTAHCAEEGCSAERTWSSRTVFDPKGAVARVHSAGWETGKRVVCPDCKKKKKEKKPMPKPVERPALGAVWSNEKTPANDVPEPSAPAASDAAKKAKRMVYRALEDYYDDVRRAYRVNTKTNEPHSDATIAKELGVAEAFVAKIREDDFGPIAEPSELSALRADLAGARNGVVRLHDEFKAELGRMGKEIEKVEGRFLANMQAALDKVTFIEDRLSGLCTKNGWRS